MKPVVFAVLLGSGAWGVLAVLLVFALRLGADWLRRRRARLNPTHYPDPPPWVECPERLQLRNAAGVGYAIQCGYQAGHTEPHSGTEITWGGPENA